MVQRDPQGYILTGPDVIRDASGEPSWRLARAPYALETSLPGVFAAGDVRHRATRRVSAAVADGAIIGQWLKHDGRWWNPVDPRRVERLMSAVSAVRSA